MGNKHTQGKFPRTRYKLLSKSHDPAGRTHPFLRRPSDPEEEDDQRGGQQLPDEKNDPKHNITAITQ